MESPGAHCLIISGTRSQADSIFGQCADFARSHAALDKRLWVRDHIKTIDYTPPKKQRQGRLRIITNDPNSVAGPDASFVAADELASWPMSTAHLVWDKLQRATAARTNSLFLTLSTAQYNSLHVGKEEFDRAVTIKATPAANPHYLPCVYSLNDTPELWTQEESWKSVNPAWGHILNPEEFRNDFHCNVVPYPRNQARFKVESCNIWSGHSDQWIGTLQFDACKKPFREEEFYGCKVFGGIDAARRRDLFSICYLAERDGVLHIIPRFYCPAHNIEQRERYDNIPYRSWAKESNLKLSPGDTIDFAWVGQQMEEDAKKFKVVEFGYDDKMMEGYRQNYEAKGFRMIEVRQNAGVMTKPTLAFESMVESKQIAWDGNKILAYCVQNATVKESANGGIMIDKKVAKSNKRIDGLSALLIALQRWLDNKGQTPMKFYSV